jgi:hypothetical protein
MPEETKECTCKDPISAFAFNTGRALEAFMNNYNNGLTNEYQLLQAKILDFNSKLGILLTNYLTAGEGDYETISKIKDLYQATFNITNEFTGNIPNEQNNG